MSDSPSSKFLCGACNCNCRGLRRFNQIFFHFTQCFTINTTNIVSFQQTILCQSLVYAIAGVFLVMCNGEMFLRRRVGSTPSTCGAIHKVRHMAFYSYIGMLIRIKLSSEKCKNKKATPREEKRKKQNKSQSKFFCSLYALHPSRSALYSLIFVSLIESLL